MPIKTVLAIDPGASKCGLALVSRQHDGAISLIRREILQRAVVLANIVGWLDEQPVDLLVVGSGTQSRSLVKEIRDKLPHIGILVVDEKDTTLQARERYWEYHPRRGWRRLLPSTMQEPPEPVDDFAALILAERVLEA